jgi:predicted transcriptional regulator
MQHTGFKSFTRHGARAEPNNHTERLSGKQIIVTLSCNYRSSKERLIVSSEGNPDPLTPERALNYHLLEFLMNGPTDMARIMEAWRRMPIRRDEVRARLEQLVRRGLVQREDARYSITEKGRAAMVLYEHPSSHWGFKGDDELMIWHVVLRAK